MDPASPLECDSWQVLRHLDLRFLICKLGAKDPDLSHGVFVRFEGASVGEHSHK